MMRRFLKAEEAQRRKNSDAGEASNQLLDIRSKVRKETRSFSAEEAR